MIHSNFFLGIINATNPSRLHAETKDESFFGKIIKKTFGMDKKTHEIDLSK
jgi:hypothetical protein